MSVTLKVGYPPGKPLKSKQLKFKTSLQVKEVIAQICSEGKIRNPEKYVLLLPPPTPELNSFWLEEKRALSTYPLQNKDYVELRNKHQIIRVLFRRARERALIDVNEPLSAALPQIAKRFQIQNIQDYKLFLYKHEIDVSKSIRELAISTDVTFTLKSKDDDLEEEEYTDNIAKEKKKEEEQKASEQQPQENAEPVNLQAPAKSIKNPQHSGFLHVSQGKDKSIQKKKFEKRYHILKEQYLFQYKSQTDSKPLNVINLDGYSMRLFKPDEKDKKLMKEFQFTFELFSESDQMFVKCENENQLKSWMSAIDASMKRDGAEKQEPKVFGAPLSKVCMDREIPELVEQCIQYLETQLDTVGIFRLSGSAIEIENYKKQADKGIQLDFSKETDPHCVAGLLKLYFRELPEPLCTFELYDQFIAAQAVPDHNLRMRYLKGLIAMLPKVNKALLTYLISFLHRVEQHSENNKMAIHNLATVFAPNLLASPDRNMFTMVQDTPIINGIVNTFIKEYSSIFGDKNTIIAVALYDYEGQEASELSFKKGDEIKVIIQGEEANSWWQGEINGKIGRFPGSYVEVKKTKTKKQKFKEEMTNVKQKIEEEKDTTASLRESKASIEKEIQALQEEKKEFDKKVHALKVSVMEIIEKEKIDLVTSLEKYFSKLDVYNKERQKMQELRKSFGEDLKALRNFIKHPPPEMKKHLSKKSSEKIDSSMVTLVQKWNADQKKRFTHSERFEELFYDVSALNKLTHMKIEEEEKNE